ncbi:SusC/RagA family TonB-linked outer membrane protein [uncultured Algibacter sp.]|uniref:SusC/RagA family TonB-linked outer membrane protein n=1 Tax=uncultured Algibacter sp. TaxID=298659 RepID=UPI0032169048
MKTKFSGILTLLLAFVVQLTFAQEKAISGTVTDASGLPLPGTTVLIKGTSSGTSSDFDGKYAISTSQGATLVFSFVGYETQEILIGSSDVINVTMVDDAESLEEVVVTALGIERNAKSLGYGVTTIKSEDLNEVRETNVLAALNGKSSGILVTNQSGNVGGSTRILIRGNSSLSGTVQPLFVVDGVPISNANTSTFTDRITGGFDFGNRGQDINPDDIDTVTILKGASAAALYGSRASGGVIIITTKRGKQGQKANISFSTTFRFDNPLKLPDFQNEYISGDDGEYDFDPALGPNGQVTSGWGPNINTLNGVTHTDAFGNENTPFRIFKNGVEDFWQNAHTSINSLSVSGAADNGDDYRLSLSYTDQKGLVPTSGLNRTNLGFNAGKTLSDKLKSRFGINYVRTNTVGTAAGGANDPNVLTTIVNLLPRNIDFTPFDQDVDEFGNQINDPGGQTNNPYFIARQNAPKVSVQRFFGNASLQWLAFKDFDILGRAGYDTFTDTRFLQNSIGTVGRETGGFTDDFINQRELTLDLIATYNKDINDDFNITTRAGMQWNERVFERLRNTATVLTVPELFDPGNAEANTLFKDFRQRRILGVFGDLTVDYKNWLILNATGRNDFSSTLPVDANSFFYPSVSLSWIFTDALNIESNVLTYGKLRGSWAEVGSDTNSFLLDFTFNPDTAFFGQFGTDGTFPFDGQLAFNSDASLTNPALKPSIQQNFEIGTELGFLKNRIFVDLTYYKNNTTDDIIFVPTPQTSGFSSFLTNVAEVSNEGIELQINAKVIRAGNFSWDIDYNFTKNEFRVEDLGDIPSLNLATEFNGLGVRAVEGKELQLFGRRWARAQDADGNDIENQILVDEDGIRLDGNQENLGNIAPDFTMGLTSTFKYKGWRLSTTFDYREGGKVFSNTVGALRRAGLAAETGGDRTNLFVDPNTFTQPGGPGTEVIPNTTPISSVQDYWGGFASAGTVEGNVFDATFIKWRELSLTYTFPSSIIDRTPFKSLQIGAQARNLAIFNSDVPHIDPESGLGGSGSQLDGIERGGIPSTSSYGFNLIANF